MGDRDWINEVAAVWEITDDDQNTVKSYRVYNEHGLYDPFPEALISYPSAITYITAYIPHYDSGEQYDLYQGVTELHCKGNVGKEHYPYVMSFLNKVRDAAAMNTQLGGKVSWFRLLYESGPGTFAGTGIEGPGALSYGSEEEHLGLLINWAVKEVVDVTIKA